MEASPAPSISQRPEKMRKKKLIPHNNSLSKTERGYEQGWGDIGLGGRTQEGLRSWIRMHRGRRGRRNGMGAGRGAKKGGKQQKKGQRRSRGGGRGKEPARAHLGDASH